MTLSNVTFFLISIQYGFRSSGSTVDLLTVVYERIVKAVNISGATRVLALDIFKPFDRI